MVQLSFMWVIHTIVIYFEIFCESSYFAQFLGSGKYCIVVNSLYRIDTLRIKEILYKPVLYVKTHSDDRFSY